MFFKIVGASVWLVCLTTLGYAQGQDHDSLYPLAVGSKWTYSISDQKADLTVRVARKEKLDEMECFVIETAKNDKVVATEHLAVVDKKVIRLRLSDIAITPPLIFARTELRPGDKWNAVYTLVLENKKVESKVDFLAVGEKVKVPIGEFDAIKVTGTMDKGGTTLWLVKGMGPVKIQFDLGQRDKATLELKAIDIPK